MKIFSLFTKAPNYQRFSYTPRFYDAQKEEMQERERRIKYDLDRERGIAKEEPGQHRSRIAGSFQAARKRSKPSIGANATMMRLGIILFLVLLIIAFFEWGKPALYSLFLVIPVYLYLKFKGN
jgi:Flp pilus assembly protein TadB